MSIVVSAGGQIPLAIRTPERPGFDLFVAGGNREALLAVRAAAALTATDCLYIWGAKGTGKSHLLQAACIHASEAEHPVAYIPLAGAGDMQPEVLADLDTMDLVCVDDIDAVAGLPQWEQPLLHLYNRLRDRSAVMIMSSALAPRAATFTLPDLNSRLSWGLVYHLQALDDGDKVRVLQQRADARAFDLPDDVAAYMVKRVPRDLPGLLRFLDKLEQATLAEKRKLTIPFVKTILD